MRRRKTQVEFENEKHYEIAREIVNNHDKCTGFSHVQNDELMNGFGLNYEEKLECLKELEEKEIIIKRGDIIYFKPAFQKHRPTGKSI